MSSKASSSMSDLEEHKGDHNKVEKIILNGSGRTDTGVHAIEQSGHFDCKNEIKNSENSRYNYPFTTCVNCGPRYAITENFPFERRWHGCLVVFHNSTRWFSFRIHH